MLHNCSIASLWTWLPHVLFLSVLTGPSWQNASSVIPPHVDGATTGDEAYPMAGHILLLFNSIALEHTEFVFQDNNNKLLILFV